MQVRVLPRMWADSKAITFNGVDEHLYINAPSFAGHTAGTICVDVKLNSLLGSDGATRVWCGADTGVVNSQFQLNLRRNTAFGSGTHFDMTYRAGGSGNYSVGTASTLSLSTGTWYRVVITSESKMWVDKTAMTLSTYSSFVLPSGNMWFGNMTLGGSLCFAVAARRFGGTPGVFSDIRTNNLVIYNRVLTGAEIIEEYDAIRAGRSPWSCSFADAIVSAYPFEDTAKDHDDFLNDLTEVNIDGTNYVTP